MTAMKESSGDDLQSIIRNCADSGRIVLTDHAKERMGSRGYTIHDVLLILSEGTISDVRQEGPGRCRCRVTGRDIEGDPGSVVVSVIKKSRVIIVTVLGGSDG